MPNLFAVPAGLAGDHRAEMPRAVARFLQIAVDPDDIGDGKEEQEGRGVDEHRHRELVIARPVPARGRIDRRDQRPGQPQSGQLDDADVEHILHGARMAPVDAGARAQMDLVDNDRPDHHRHPGSHAADQRRARPIPAEMARQRDPAQKSDQSDQARAMAHRAGRTGVGQGGRSLGHVARFLTDIRKDSMKEMLRVRAGIRRTETNAARLGTAIMA